MRSILVVLVVILVGVGFVAAPSSPAHAGTAAAKTWVLHWTTDSRLSRRHCRLHPVRQVVTAISEPVAGAG